MTDDEISEKIGAKTRVNGRVEHYLQDLLSGGKSRVAIGFFRDSRDDGVPSGYGYTRYLDCYPVPDQPPLFRPGRQSVYLLLRESTYFYTADEVGFGLICVQGGRILLQPLLIGGLRVSKQLPEWVVEIINSLLQELGRDDNPTLVVLQEATGAI